MRYFQPAQSQYISDYTPLPLDTMYKVGQDLVDSDLAAAEAVSKAFNVTGGYRTQEAAKKLSEQYNAEAKRIADELASNTIDSKTATRRINALTNSFNTSEQKKLIDYDAAKSGQVQKYITSPGAERDLLMDSWVIDPTTGQRKFIPLTGNEKFEDIDREYNALAPSDTFNEMKDIFKDMLPKTFGNKQTREYLSRMGISENDFKNAEILGDGVFKVKTVNGTQTVKLTPSMVRQQLEDWVDANWDNTDKNHFHYNRKAGNFKTKKDWVDHLTKTFVGEVDNSVTETENSFDYLRAPEDKDGQKKKTNVKGDDYEIKEPYATTPVTVTGNTYEYVNPINGEKESVPGAENFHNRLIETEGQIKNLVNTTAEKYKNYGVTVDTDENGDSYLKYDGNDNITISKLADENIKIKQIQIDQKQNERLFMNAVDRVRDTYANFDPRKIDPNALKEASEELYEGVTESWYQIKYNVPNELIDAAEKLYEEDPINFKNNLENWIVKNNNVNKYFENLSNNDIVKKSFEKANEILFEKDKALGLFNQIIKEEYDGTLYNDQTLLRLSSTEPSGSGGLKQVIKGNFYSVNDREAYIQNAAKNESLKEFWNKYDTDSKYKTIVDAAIEDQSYLRFDYNENKFVVHVRVPNYDSTKANFEIEIQSPLNQALMETYANEHGYDSQFLKMAAEKSYSQSLKESNGLFGELKGEGINIKTQTVTTDRTIKDTNGDIELKEGNTVFTLPDEIGVLFKASLRNKLHLFHNDMNEAKLLMNPKNPEEVQEEGRKKYNDIMSNLNKYGMQAIKNQNAYQQFSFKRRFHDVLNPGKK
jgi:hypothetical protein